MEDSSELSTALHTALMARSIECIGDHAKNISEYVIYMMEGREIRNFTI
jgi:phosphate transport system protein